MNEIVREWIDKAQGDYLTATREADADPPNYDAACFHAQQCIEKLLKALLIAEGQVPPRTHDLVILSGLLSSLRPQWDWAADQLRLLSRAAVVFRYPGESAGPEEATAALNVASAVRTHLLTLVAEKEA